VHSLSRGISSRILFLLWGIVFSQARAIVRDDRWTTSGSSGWDETIHVGGGGGDEQPASTGSQGIVTDGRSDVSDDGEEERTGASARATKCVGDLIATSRHARDPIMSHRRSKGGGV